MPNAVRVRPGDKVRLEDIPTGSNGGLEKAAGLAKIDELGQELGALLELLFAASKHSLLVILQGRDTAGKDGAVRRILSYSNVQTSRVAAFKVPTPIELAHDFLWRIHAQVPPKGGVTMFNRSHYEDVLIVRVHNLVPEPVWKKRYSTINAFEENLTDAGTIIVKFLLHISKEEQEERLLAREKDAQKYWKLSVADWTEREYWDDYTRAYEDVLQKCTTHHAPWYVIPADRKWFRDLAIAEALVEVLKPYRDEWKATLEVIGDKAKAELAAMRANASEADKQDA